MFDYEGEWWRDEDGARRRVSVKQEQLIHGYGLMRWVQGISYEGHFENGFRNGLGVMEQPNGHVYIGFWKQNFKCGRGLLFD